MRPSRQLAGLCPGNNQSAGKRRNGKTRKGSVFGFAVDSLYGRMIVRRGKEKTLVGVTYTMLQSPISS
jgi:hypothetical protein